MPPRTSPDLGPDPPVTHDMRVGRMQLRLAGIQATVGPVAAAYATDTEPTVACISANSA